MQGFGFTFRLPEVPNSEFGTLVANCGLLVLLETFFRVI